METLKYYDRYPGWIVLISNLVSFLLYLMGFLIISTTGLAFGALYIAYVIFLEFRIIRFHCINCWYWGNTCAFGKGRISSFFFRKGEPSAFCDKEMKWKDMIPDLAVSLIPFITGIVLLIVDFRILILAAMLVLVILTTAGNALVRGKLACRYCKQKEAGCPAEKLFSKD